jgi:iron complex transport system substrate-binding protein
MNYIGFRKPSGARAAAPATLALILALAAPGCRAAAGAPKPISLVDDAGNTVRLAAPPRRIVSLNPVFTELVFALGAGDRLVGRTSQCDFPAEAARVPDVGLWLPPNVEAVLARAPDLVLLYQSPSTAAAIARLRALHVPAAAFRTDDLRDVSRLARVLGPVLGAEPAALRLADRYDSSLAALQRRWGRDPLGPVAVVAWDNPLIVLGAGSFVSEMVELAGARNIFADVRSASAPMALEVLAARRPRAVLVAGTGAAGFARPEWQAVEAIRERRLMLLADPALQRPSPRAPGAIAALRSTLDSLLRQPRSDRGAGSP